MHRVDGFRILLAHEAYNPSNLRFGQGPEGQIFLLNKGDGTIRMLVK